MRQPLAASSSLLPSFRKGGPGVWEEKERESQRLSDRVCSSNSGRATRAHKGRGTVTQLPPLVLFPCTEAVQSHPLSVAFLRPACLLSSVCLLLSPRPLCREWFDLLRLQWHTRGEIGSCVPCLALASVGALDLMPDRVTFLVTLAIKCLPARRLFSCTHPSLR